MTTIRLRARWRGVLLALLALLAVSFTPRQAVAQDIPALAGRTMLLMVDDPGCVYCRKWEREVAQGYVNSTEGRALPLVRRQRGHPDLAGIGGLAYTPTFIVVVNGREAGRIVGYPGADFFWAEFGRLIARLGII